VKLRATFGSVLATALLASTVLADDRALEPGTPPIADDLNLDVVIWLRELSQIPAPNINKRPIDRYDELLPYAEARDRDAQYELAKIYEVCVSAPDDSLLGALKEGGMPDETLNLLLRSREICDGFDVAYEDWDEPRDAVKYWMSQALAQEHPVARVEESIMSYRRWKRAMTRAELLGETLPEPMPLISEQEVFLALSHGAAHPDMLGYAVRQGYLFFRMFRAEDYMAQQGYNPSDGHVKRGPLREAWSILGCYHLASCSVEKHLEGMGPYYYSYEIDETVQTVLALHYAIMDQDWETLGLKSNF
jgi:hypothetical protein